jgi:hypothetical protein
LRPSSLQSGPGAKRLPSLLQDEGLVRPSLNFLHHCLTPVTHNSITIHTTQSTMNLSRALSFCVKKTDHSLYLTTGGSGDDSVHVSSAITHRLRSENA